MEKDIFTEALEKSHSYEGFLGSINESKQEFLEKGRKAQIGEIREWKGQKFQKQANGGWLPVKGEKKSEKKDEASDVELEEQVLAAIPNGDNGSYEYIDLEGILRAMPGTGKTPEDKVKKIEAILDKKAKKYTVASQTFYTLSDKVDEETIREDLIEEGLLKDHSESDKNRTKGLSVSDVQKILSNLKVGNESSIEAEDDGTIIIKFDNKKKAVDFINTMSSIEKELKNKNLHLTQYVVGDSTLKEPEIYIKRY